MTKPRTFSVTVCAGVLVLLFGATVRDTLAQGVVITGKVVGRQGEPLSGANVAIVEVGTSITTTTAGVYTMTVPPERAKGQTVTLRARSVGYSPGVKQITLTPGTQTQDFQLQFDPFTLNEVVVTGTAEATEQRNLTFAVGRVDASQLNQVPAVSALGSLEGKVAGVRVIQGSGAPGSDPVIRLRGATAITSQGSCNAQPWPSTAVPGPLVVVDGTITHYSLADISPQDIERVEVVKGAAASSLYGSNAANGVVQIFTKRGDRLPDGKLAVTVRNEYGQSFRPKLIPIAHAHPYLTADSAYTDTSGSAVLKGDFIDATGQLVGVGGVPSPKPDQIADVPYSAYPHPVNFDVQGDLLTHGPFYTNYVSIGQRRGNSNYNFSVENTKQEGVLRLLKGHYNYDYEASNYSNLRPKGFLSASGIALDGNLTKTDSGGREFNTGVTVTGVRNFRLGSLNVRNTTKAAYEYEDQKASNFTLFAGGFKVVATPEFNAVDFANLAPGSSNQTLRSKNYYVVSGFNVNDRYLFDGLVRWDGSSLFGPESRWQTYYRASGAYRLSQDFHINGIDELKLRASYGTAGLRPAFDAQYETYAVVGGIPAKHTLGNTALRPALSKELELGTNIDFLGHFSLDYSYSRKETKDQIMLVPLSSASGYLNQWQNAGTLLGKTHELSLGVILADRPDFSWRLNVAADRTRQTVTQLNTAPFLVGPGGYGGNHELTQDFKIATGDTFGVFYGTKIVRTFAELCDDPAKKAAGCGPGKTYDPANYIRNEDGYLVPLATYHTAGEQIIFYTDPAGNKNVKIGDVNPDFNASFTTT